MKLSCILKQYPVVALVSVPAVQHLQTTVVVLKNPFPDIKYKT